MLAPTGKGGQIASVRRHGRYVLSFNAPAAGEVTISWYLVPKGAHVGTAKHPKPVLVATGHAVATHAGKLTVTVKLTPKGRALTAHARRLKLTAKGSFKVNGRPVVTATKPFVLH